MGLYRDTGNAGAISFEILEAVCSPGANVSAVWGRSSMLTMLRLTGQRLSPWQHEEDLDDSVFRVAATFPMEGMKRGVIYSEWPLDVDGFLERLRQQDGAS